MRTIDEKVKKSIVEKINAVRKANNLTEIAEDAKKSVGNNGYTPGDKIELTGNLNPAVEVLDANGKVTATYIGLETASGEYVSLQSLMGLSSLRGYSTAESAINEYLDNKEKVSVMISPYVSEDFDFEDRWIPETRDLYDMAAIIAANPQKYAGTWTFMGAVVRQIVAKQDSKPNSFEQYKKGYKRAMTAKIWQH